LVPVTAAAQGGERPELMLVYLKLQTCETTTCIEDKTHKC